MQAPSAPPPEFESKTVTINGQQFEQECEFSCSLRRKRAEDLDRLLSSSQGVARRAPIRRTGGFVDASKYLDKRSHLKDIYLRTGSLYRSNYRVKNINSQKSIRVGDKEYVDFLEDTALIDSILDDIDGVAV